MPDSALEAAFLEQRPRLFKIAYRMMGSVADAEDVLQDVFVKLRTRAETSVATSGAYLTQAVVRRCLDDWKSARRRREEYVGPWLPEPLDRKHHEDPSEREELAESVSLAFLVLLESLTPVERAVFLLHDVFQYSFDEVAAIVDKTPAACRQLAHRARQRVRQDRPRFRASRDEHLRLVERFMRATQSGDLAELRTVLATDVTVYSDGGGMTPAARAPVVGFERVTRFVLGLQSKAERSGVTVTHVPTDVNGGPGFLRLIDGRLHAVISFDIADNQIQRMYSILNPHKLAAIAAAHNLEGATHDSALPQPPDR